METAFYIETPAIEIAEDQRLLKASAYREYVNASGLLTAANARARKISSLANSAYHQQKSKGFEHGYDEGKREAARIISTATIEAAIFKDKFEEVIIDTIIVTLKNILGSIGDDKILYRIISKTLKSNKSNRHLTIRVCPNQKIIVQSAVDTFHRKTRINGMIEVVADSTLKRGRCLVQSEFSSVDVGVDVQLQMIETLLTEHILRLKKR